MATLAIQTNLTLTGTTGLIGAAAVSKSLTINAAAPVLQRTQEFAATGGSDEAVDLGDVVAATGYVLEIVNTSADDLDLSSATGGSFAGAKHSKVFAGSTVVMNFKAAVYAKSAGSGVVVALTRVVENRPA